MKNIGVEKDLSSVFDYLKDNGYNVKKFDNSQKNNKDFIDGFDAVVICGLDENITGDETTISKASIIDARGLSPVEIKREIDTRMR